MRKQITVLVAVFSLAAFALTPTLATAEVDKAVIAILGGMT